MNPPFSSAPGEPSRDVLGAWNLGGEPPPDDGLDGSMAVFPRGDDPAPGLSSADAPGRARGLIGPASSLPRGSPFPDFTIRPEGAEAGPGLHEDSVPGPPAPDPAARPRPGGAGRVDLTLAPPRPGDMVSGFRVVTELGRGAFARVYLAEQTDLGDRLVALKVSRAEGEEPQMLARLQHTHIVPIHSVHDDPETGLRLICMPYLGGANLAQVLDAAGARPAGHPAGGSLVDALDEASQRFPSARSSRPVSGLGAAEPEAVSPEAGEPPAFSTGSGSLARVQTFWGRFSRRGGRDEPAPARPGLDDRDFDQPARQFLREASSVQAAVWVVARLAEGLEHAHSRGLLHRDLKPSNVLIAADGTPMLLDFNLSSPARASDPEEGRRAALGGTLPYMSPEHLDAFDPKGTTPPEAVDERSDLYALGLILFEAVSGEHPFPEPPPRTPWPETIRFLKAQRATAPSLRAARPGVPWGLDSVVRKCLDPDPARRYARARDLAEDLNRLLDDLPLKHAPEPSPRERLSKWARRNPRLCGTTSVGLLAASLIASLGGLIGLFSHNMQALSARLKLQAFGDDVAECRFLLNVTGGPAEHLARGVARAARALDHEAIDPGGGFRPGSWVHRLTRREQAEVREQTAELILMEARALVGLARTEPERRRALEWAVEWLGRAERLDPSPPSALYADRARYHAALGQADLAARDRALAARKPPVTGRDFTLLGASLLARGDPGRAEPALLRAVDLGPRHFWAWFVLGHCHFEQGRYLEAAGDFAACVALEPKFAWPHFNRGVSLARAGRLAEARAAYGRAVEANPRFAEAWLNRALADLELNDPAAAESAVSRAIALGRNDTGARAVWAEVKARRGDRAAAERLFDRLLAEAPDDPVLRTARGVFRVDADPDGALADLRRALEVDPHNARAHLGVALCLRRGSPREALAEADAALRDDPGLLDALQLRALLRARLGDLAAVDDVERLGRVPTPHRLYNAACALALLVATADESRLATRALGLLDRALDAGFPAAHAADDPDLNALRRLPGFGQALAKARPSADARR